MKTRTKAGTALKSLLAALGGAAMVLGALTPLQDAAAQSIATSRHNLSSSGTGSNSFSGTDQICVFCHTPHGANTGAGNPPLWNKNVAALGPYTVYSSSSMDASRATDGVVGSTSIGSVSIACLSCHDGSQAMNAVINAPGSGLTNAGYTAGTWTGPALTATPVGSMGATVANLTTDLSNDHPIGMAYCAWTTKTASTLACGDSDFNTAAAANIGGQDVFWVDTGGAGRSKTDLPLFNRTFATLVGSPTGPSVECATCHDPHNATNATFLRISNTGSAVCLTCHNK